ncbi:hypothetical protein [Alicyclobacillus sp. ALC3]|nr:hypothetical protein [Alicyclobacillus sp. ALC3]
MTSEQERVRNVDAAIEIIQYLATPVHRLGVRETARMIDLPKSTA